MILQEVIDRVESISREFDDESAHCLEDGLYREVLFAISQGQCQDAPPEDFAAEAIKASEIGFTRWYA